MRRSFFNETFLTGTLTGVNRWKIATWISSDPPVRERTSGNSGGHRSFGTFKKKKIAGLFWKNVERFYKIISELEGRFKPLPSNFERR